MTFSRLRLPSSAEAPDLEAVGFKLDVGGRVGVDINAGAPGLKPVDVKLDMGGRVGVDIDAGAPRLEPVDVKLDMGGGVRADIDATRAGCCERGSVAGICILGGLILTGVRGSGMSIDICAIGADGFR